MDHDHTVNSDSIEEASPALWARILQAFSKEDCSVLQKTYKFAVLHNGLSEGAVVRAPEVSFNPRPARLGVLLLNLRNQRISPPNFPISRTLIQGALLYGVKGSEMRDSPYSEVLPLIEEAQELRQGISVKQSTSVEFSSKEALLLSAVAWLDDLRHLHMTSLVEEAINEVLVAADRFLITHKESLPKELSALLETAQSQQKRRVNRKGVSTDEP